MNLFQKYNRQAPRYTSYPPVPFWKNAPDEAQWFRNVTATYNEEEGMDLYVHVPFCERLCYYCGCNRVVTRNHNIEEPFVELIILEWEMYQKRLGFIPKINSLHFGGGTPTFLSADNLEKIIRVLTINKSPSFKGSIEIDPRNVNSDHFDCFTRNGITRVSLGIQDFDPNVQSAINRSQSFELVESVVKELRGRSIESINFDVIYGLPRQTLESITKTFDLIRGLKPDLIAYYSYAHLPEKLVNQRLIKAEELPQGEFKQELYETGKAILAGDGYIDVGMDHFALPENFLYKAKESERLHRNFMGYVDKKSSVLVGLGPSSISDSSMSFIQNSKNFNDYEAKIRSNQLAISQGHTHDRDDLRVQKIILDLMCTSESTIPDKNDIPYWKEINLDLEVFEKDGLLAVEKNKITVLPSGKKFIRNIAMVFDFYIRQKLPVGKFSQTI